ncbi:hypothetical protein [Rhizobium tropici]|uniref:Uncharacterized protein n=1 Tax=Rhizobium tropici TaxID=398 RepID=A0A329YN21_RHITR|nr:hypothetical protein [Rhizobium tropici]RAX42420.1 hypothetical protein DQ393_06145 [Rhizobium tropici]
MTMASLETEMGWLPLLLTALVLALAVANAAPAGSAFSAFRNGMLLAGAVIASAAVWLMWAVVLR